MTDSGFVPDSNVGQVIGSKYRVVRLIGQGGMGRVYEAQHTVIGRRFAIKCLLAEHTQQSEMVARFQREAEAAGGIENENIAAVLDFGLLDEGSPYLVMEYLEGEDLAQILRRLGPLAVPRAAYIGIQACRGLAAAHARDIIHRDLKPENLFVCKRNDGSDLVKILDFGIAKLHAPVSLTNTGASMGTPSYMSVEQARGAKNVDQRADIYALGVILYEMLAGQRPHPGESYNEILYHVITEKPTPLVSLRPTMPVELVQVIERAMARDACERYASAIEMAEALAPFADRAITPVGLTVQPGQARAETCPSPLSLPILFPADTQAVAPNAQRPKLRTKRWLVSGAILALVGLLFLLWRSTALLRREARANASAESSQSSGLVTVRTPSNSSNSASTAIDSSLRAGKGTEGSDETKRPGGRPLGQSDSASPAASNSSTPAVVHAKPANVRPPPVTNSRPFDRNNPYAN